MLKHTASLLLLVAAVACSPRASVPMGAECTTSFDCRAGLVCVSARCSLDPASMSSAPTTGVPGSTASTTVAAPIVDPALPGPTAQITVNAGVVTVSWTAQPGVSKHRVYRSAQSGSGYSLVAEVANNGAQLVDNGAQLGVAYYYIVRGVSGSVESLASNEVNARPLSGREIFAALEGQNQPILVFDLLQQGNVAPLRSLSLASSGASTITAIRATASELFVLAYESGTRRVHVLNAAASGAATPLRSSPTLPTAIDIAVSAAKNRLFVLLSNQTVQVRDATTFVLVYTITAGNDCYDGDALAACEEWLRVAYDATNNEVIVLGSTATYFTVTKYPWNTSTASGHSSSNEEGATESTVSLVALPTANTSVVVNTAESQDPGVGHYWGIFSLLRSGGTESGPTWPSKQPLDDEHWSYTSDDADAVADRNELFVATQSLDPDAADPQPLPAIRVYSVSSVQQRVITGSQTLLAVVRAIAVR